MKSNFNQALILCGGKGERLRPLTNKIPKPLINIGAKPILNHQINYLSKNGIDNFLIATGYKSELVEEFINQKFNHLNIRIVNHGDVDIYERIKKSINFLDDHFLVCYGDTLANIDIQKLKKFHSKHSGSVTVSSFQLKSQFGILETNKKNQVLSFLEQPLLDAWINIGYFVFKKKILSKKSINFADYLSELSNIGELYTYKHKGIHITVNTISELENAKKEIKNFKGY